MPTHPDGGLIGAARAKVAEIEAEIDAMRAERNRYAIERARQRDA